MINCNIVKDLLPAYIDGLTSEETNKELSKHIESCESCHAICAQMKEPMLIDLQKEKRTVSFLKKVKRRTWRNTGVILGGVLIVIAIFSWVFIIGSPVSLSDVKIISHHDAENPFYGGGEMIEYADGSKLYSDEWKDDSRMWSLSVFFNDRHIASVFTTKYEDEFNEDGSLKSQTIIITARKVRPLIANGSGFSYGIHVSRDTPETTVIIRLSDGDIVFYDEEIRGRFGN